MERFLQDWKNCDMSLIWKAQLDDKLPKVSRRRLENVKLGKIIQKDFSQMIDENSLAIGKWGYILFGTCVIQKKKLAYLLVDSRKLLTQISTAGRSDFKIKKKIPKIAEIDENFEIPELNMNDLTDIMNGNTARPQDITLRERREEFLTFDEDMLDFSNTLAINLDDPEQVRHVQDLFEHTNNTNFGHAPSFANSFGNREQDLSGNQSSNLNLPPEVTPQAEQPTKRDPLPEIPEPPVEDNRLPSDMNAPPEQFADPPSNQVPQPDPDNFKLRELTSHEIREIRTPKNQRDGQPKLKKAKRNQKLIIDAELECSEFNKLRKSKEIDMHTNSKEDIADYLGFANEHSDFRNLKMFNPWFGLEHRTLRQLYSAPLIRIPKVIDEAIDFSCVKNGKEIQQILNERNRDESNLPGGASGTFGNGTGVEDRTNQSAGFEQHMTANLSDVQQKAQEDLPSFPQDVTTNQTNGQPEAPVKPDVLSSSRHPSPPRLEIPSIASLDLHEPNSSRSHRSSQYSFTSQDGIQSISYELTKTGHCTFHDVASKLKDRQRVASSFYQLLVMANTEQVSVSQSRKTPFADIKIKKNDI